MQSDNEVKETNMQKTLPNSNDISVNGCKTFALVSQTNCGSSGQGQFTVRATTPQ